MKKQTVIVTGASRGRSGSFFEHQPQRHLVRGETVYLLAKNGFITGMTINVDGGFAAGCNLKNSKPN